MSCLQLILLITFALSIVETLISPFVNLLSKPEKSDKMAAVVAQWNYEEDSQCGPCSWPNAETGRQQSPIDLKLSKMKVYQLADTMKFVNYHRPINGELVNNGHSVQFVPDSRIDAPEIYGGMLDQSYRFVQYHYHWAQNNNEGSEHTLGGLSYPAELHLVHQGVDDPSKLAVLGVFLQIGKDDSAVSADETVLGEIVNFGDRAEIRGQILDMKLPENKCSFARYQGSLTTPPCTENHHQRTTRRTPSNQRLQRQSSPQKLPANPAIARPPGFAHLLKTPKNTFEIVSTSFTSPVIFLTFKM
uniref:Carbonic anhydrase n=1 Tax=Panagrolaimus sp. JU765 TaxID=591449 RepID=A0AC34QTQ5_9BILA